MKKTITGTYIREHKPDSHRTIRYPLEAAPRNRRWVQRLSWANLGVTQKVELEDVLDSYSEQILPGASIFLDTCFVRNFVGPEFIARFKQHRLIAIKSVQNELNSYLSGDKSGVETSDRCRHFLGARDPVWLWKHDEAGISSVFHYYKSLLVLRKLEGRAFFDKNNALKPGSVTQSNFGSLFKNQGQLVLDRDVRIARKGFLDFGKPNYETDEALVVAAVMHAISTGSETHLLTSDEDLYEQFYKLIYLVDTHYRSYCFARYYTENLGEFMARPRTAYAADFLADRFCGPNDVIVSTPIESLSEYVLPKDYRAVAITLGLLKKINNDSKISLSQTTFMAETQIRHLFAIKAATNGMNSDLYERRNAHISCAPSSKPDAISIVAFAQDRMLTSGFSGLLHRHLDVIYALSSVERYSTLQPV